MQAAEPGKVLPMPWLKTGPDLGIPLDVTMGSPEPAPERTVKKVVGGSASKRAVKRKSGMSDVTREEINAKLEAVEARVEARYVALEGKIDRIGDQIANAVIVLGAKSDQSTEAARRAEDKAETAGKSASGTRWTVVGTAIALLAILLGILSVWQDGLSMVGTLLSAKPVATSPDAN
jgi:hypothetical protein